MNQDGTYQWAPNDPGAPKEKIKKLGRMSMIILIVLIIALGIALAFVVYWIVLTR